jgi:acyl-coenzyme A synthetase/AMP-(fatty) acid ligase
VVATANSSLSDTELQGLVRRRLAGYKVPRRIVLVPRLPRTPAGKLELSRVKSIAESTSRRNAWKPIAQ